MRDRYALERLVTPLIERQGKLEHTVEHLRATAVATSPIARYTTAAGQSIANNTVTVVDFGTAVIDTHSRVTTGAAWKFTAAVAGYYYVSAALQYAATATWAPTEQAVLYLYRNGTIYSILDRADDTPASSVQVHLSGDDVVSLLAADYIDIRTVNGSGGTLALDTNATFNHVNVVRLT